MANGLPKETADIGKAVEECIILVRKRTKNCLRQASSSS